MNTDPRFHVRDIHEFSTEGRSKKPSFLLNSDGTLGKKVKTRQALALHIITFFKLKWQQTSTSIASSPILRAAEGPTNHFLDASCTDHLHSGVRTGLRRLPLQQTTPKTIPVQNRDSTTRFFPSLPDAVVQHSTLGRRWNAPRKAVRATETHRRMSWAWACTEPSIWIRERT